MTQADRDAQNEIRYKTPPIPGEAMPRAGEKYFARTFEGITVPANWQKRSLKVDGVSYPAYYAPAPNAHTIVGFCTGFKSSPLCFAEEIAELNKWGFSVVGMGFPLPAHGKQDFLELYLKLAHAFYFEANSPLYHGIRDDLPRTAITHSTGGATFEYHMLNEADRAQAERLLKGVVNTAIFLDTAHSSQKHHRFFSAFYQFYAHWYRARELNGPLIDRFFTRFNGITDTESDKPVLAKPLHGDALYLREFGRRLQNAAEAMPRGYRSTLPTTFIHGLKDGAACPQTAERIARHMGVDLFQLNCGHHPFDQGQQGMSCVLQALFNNLTEADGSSRYEDSLRETQRARFTRAVGNITSLPAPPTPSHFNYAAFALPDNALQAA